MVSWTKNLLRLLHHKIKNNKYTHITRQVQKISVTGDNGKIFIMKMNFKKKTRDVTNKNWLKKEKKTSNKDRDTKSKEVYRRQ